MCACYASVCRHECGIHRRISHLDHHYHHTKKKRTWLRACQRARARTHAHRANTHENTHTRTHNTDVRITTIVKTIVTTIVTGTPSSLHTTSYASTLCRTLHTINPYQTDPHLLPPPPYQDRAHPLLCPHADEQARQTRGKPS